MTPTENVLNSISDNLT